MSGFYNQCLIGFLFFFPYFRPPDGKTYPSGVGYEMDAGGDPETRVSAPTLSPPSTSLTTTTLSGGASGRTAPAWCALASGRVTSSRLGGTGGKSLSLPSPSVPGETTRKTDVGLSTSTEGVSTTFQRLQQKTVLSS